MRIKFLITLFGLLLSLPGIGQSIYNRYSSRMTADGMCYFFRNKKLTETEAINRLDYDMTYLDWKDSVTVNFTIWADAPQLPKSLKIISEVDTLVCDNLKRLFVDITKKGYEIRMSSLFSKEEIRKMIHSTSAPIFTFDMDRRNATATYSKSSWEKDSKKLQIILQLIDSTK